MTGTPEIAGGGTIIAIGIGMLQYGVTVVGSDLVTGVATIAVGAGLVACGFYAFSVGFVKRAFSVLSKSK